MPEQSFISVSRPTITVAGQDDASLGEGLVSLIIVEDINGLYRCEATFGNWGTRAGEGVDYLYFDRRTLDFGKTFQVKLGADTIFDGRVTALEAHFQDRGPRNLVVLAEDRFQDLRMTRRTRTFADASDSDVFNAVANDHGLTPSVQVTGPTYRVLSQVNQSDLAFLRERARAIDAELWMQGTTLNVRMHDDRDGETLELSYGSELREFSVLADLAHQRTSVRVSGWDVSGKQAVEHEATDAVVQSELGGRLSGASVLSSAFGARKEALAHTVPFTSQEAQAQAEAYFRMMARRFVTGRGTTEANAKLRVGNYVDLKNVGVLFNGKYYLSEVRHLFDSVHGVRTTFKAERPGLGQ